MADRFPHMTDTKFPDVDGVDVWKFKNEFDYDQFDNPQMKITICSVPWDVGLIHVGNAQIGGLGNVVDFETEAARDHWFNDLTDKYEFVTEYRKFHMEGKGGSVDGTIKLPIPYDVMAKYNYAIVEYNPLPVNLEGQGVRKWFYFVRESHMRASNTTEVSLILDAWQTFIYGMKIPYMMLQRGHAPIAALSAEEFLNSPIDNTRYITGEDVTFSDAPSVLKKETEIIFNDGDNIYACIVLDAAAASSWGTYRSTWKMPITHALSTQGVPNYICVATPVNNFNTFITNIDNAIPQFKQAVHAVFFASDKIISLGSAVTINNTQFNIVEGSTYTKELLKLDKAAFGYDKKYADLAKLYTYPYAHIEVMDEHGNGSIVRVEDTSGSLELTSQLSSVFPYINLTANISGVGGKGKRDISFKNITTRKMKYGGRWQAIQLEWDIPMFAVVQSNDITFDFDTWFDRVQLKNNADTTKSIANANATTNKTNDDSQARTNKTNADNSAANAKINSDLLADAAKANTDTDADTIIANAALDVACNNSNTSNRQTFNTQSTDFTQGMNNVQTSLANALTANLTGVNTQAQQESAGIAAMGSGIGAALSLSPSAGIQAYTSYMQAGVSIHASQSEASLQQASNTTQNAFTNLQAESINTFSNAQMRFENTAENSRITGQAANTANTAKANATRTQSANKQAATNTKATENTNAANSLNTSLAINENIKNTDDANAIRTRDNAYNAINNLIKQAALKPVNTYGEIANAKTATTRPLAAFAQVVTQSDGAIAAAGDEMLRFGYMCNMQWEFDGWLKMKNFTYWKVADMWINDFRLPDAYADRIRFTLMGGVCVWRSPDIIGKTSIYENFN